MVTKTQYELAVKVVNKYHSQLKEEYQIVSELIESIPSIIMDKNTTLNEIYDNSNKYTRLINIIHNILCRKRSLHPWDSESREVRLITISDVNKELTKYDFDNARNCGAKTWKLYLELILACGLKINTKSLN